MYLICFWIYCMKGGFNKKYIGLYDIRILVTKYIQDGLLYILKLGTYAQKVHVLKKKTWSIHLEVKHWGRRLLEMRWDEMKDKAALQFLWLQPRGIHVKSTEYENKGGKNDLRTIGKLKPAQERPRRYGPVSKYVFCTIKTISWGSKINPGKKCRAESNLILSKHTSSHGVLQRVA